MNYYNSAYSGINHPGNWNSPAPVYGAGQPMNPWAIQRPNIPQFTGQPTQNSPVNQFAGGVPQNPLIQGNYFNPSTQFTNGTIPNRLLPSPYANGAAMPIPAAMNRMGMSYNNPYFNRG